MLRATVTNAYLGRVKAVGLARGIRQRSSGPSLFRWLDQSARGSQNDQIPERAGGALVAYQNLTCLSPIPSFESALAHSKDNTAS